MSAPERGSLAALLPAVEGPTFAAPWQAHAFALAVRLHEQGVFTWTEWADALARALAADGGDDPDAYYRAWLVALEALARDRGLASAVALTARREAWADAYRRTPHGKPVTL